MLYLVATPIGNLSDITFRAIEILKQSDYILCEDTRQSSILLSHYQIKKPLKSYHKFNEARSLQTLTDDLKSGKILALISDAGTPGIADPGTRLVQACLEKEIPVVPIPGPCAAIAALTCSGLNTERFQFAGFLPKKASELKAELMGLLHYPGTSLCYESPERLLKTLQQIHAFAPERPLAVARELTKKFEEIKRGTAQQLIDYWTSHPLKGEIVLLIAGASTTPKADGSDLDPHQHVEYLMSAYHLSRKEAIKLAAEQRGLPKRQLYNALLKDPNIQ